MNYLYQGDIPKNIKFANSIAIDTEAMGLKSSRDRLCLVQISSGDDKANHRMPKSWNFFGSNDKINWHLLRIN